MSHLFQLGETCVSPFSIPSSNTEVVLAGHFATISFVIPHCLANFHWKARFVSEVSLDQGNVQHLFPLWDLFASHCVTQQKEGNNVLMNTQTNKDKLTCPSFETTAVGFEPRIFLVTV